MNKSFFKKKSTIIIIALLILVLAACVYTFNVLSTPPKLNVEIENSSNVKCIKGGYNWNYLGKHVVADDISPSKMVYTEKNTVYVSPNQKLIFTNSSSNKMYNEDIRYYDEKLNETILSTDKVPAVMEVKSVSFNAPVKAGTYILAIKMNYYDKGSVQYGVKIVVNDDISLLEQYSNTYLGDNSKVSEILNLLPYNNYISGMELSTVEAPYGITVNYSNINVSLDDLQFNSLALFTLIQNLDSIKYNIQNGEKIVTLNITRTELKQKYQLTIDGLKGYIKGEIKNIYGYTELETISKDYTLEQATEDNCFVVTYVNEDTRAYNKEFNKEVLVKFLNKVESKEAAFIRIITLTKDNDVIINDLKYSDNVFTLITDYTRDKVATESDRTYKTKTYNKIKISTGSNYDIAGVSLYNGEGEMQESSDVNGIYFNSAYAKF